MKSKQDNQDKLQSLLRDLELIHGDDGTPYAEFEVDGRKRLCPVDSSASHSILQDRFFEKYNSLPDKKALEPVISRLCFLAKKKERTKVFTRIARDGDSVVIDLGNQSYDCLVVDREGWRISYPPPLKFARPPGMLPLPYPQPGGELSTFKGLLNLESEDDFIILLSFLVSSLFPSKEFAILILQGPQGSGKSSVTQIVKELLDPSKPVLRSFPRREDEIFIGAQNSHVLCFDNLSGLSPSASDSICKIATGCGIATRKLYTNHEEVFIEISKPVVINGIDCLSSRPDLADRAVVIHLPKVSEKMRIKSSEFWDRFNQMKPQLLGCLLDALSSALENRDSLNLQELPRMADFAVTSCAALKHFGYEPAQTIAALLNNRREVALDSIETSTVARALRSFAGKITFWRGSSAELCEVLRLEVSDDESRWSHCFRSPTTIAKELNRLAPSLRLNGIEVTLTRTSKRREIIISRLQPSQPSLFHEPMTGVTVVTEENHKFNGKELERDPFQY